MRASYVASNAMLSLIQAISFKSGIPGVCFLAAPNFFKFKIVLPATGNF